MEQWSVMLGFDAEYRIPIFVDFFKTGHLCAVGGTGSGKSVAVVYFLYKLQYCQPIHQQKAIYGYQVKADQDQHKFENYQLPQFQPETEQQTFVLSE